MKFIIALTAILLSTSLSFATDEVTIPASPSTVTCPAATLSSTDFEALVKKDTLKLVGVESPDFDISTNLIKATLQDMDDQTGLTWTAKDIAGYIILDNASAEYAIPFNSDGCVSQFGFPMKALSGKPEVSASN